MIFELTLILISCLITLFFCVSITRTRNKHYTEFCDRLERDNDKLERMISILEKDIDNDK